MNKIVALDDGHGIETQGKRTPLFDDGSYMKENEFNEVVMLYLKEYLTAQNIGVLTVAPEKTDTPLSTRIKRANEAGASIYISIHANAYGSNWNEANGFETYVYDLDDKNTMYLAQCVHGACIGDTGLRNRGIKEADFYVLINSAMPAILLECGFMTNKVEAELLRSDSYKKTVAKAITKGICKYYGIIYKGVNDMTVEEAKNIIREKCGFDENTMNYLSYYKFSDSLIIRLAEQMK